MQDFKIIKRIGEGSFSFVYKVKRKHDSKFYALKKVQINSLSDFEKQAALNEIRILASVEHDNVIAYKDAFLDNKKNVLCIVMELAERGDLEQMIEKSSSNGDAIPEEKIWSYMIQIVRGLNALHELGICHRDL